MEPASLKSFHKPCLRVARKCQALSCSTSTTRLMAVLIRKLCLSRLWLRLHRASTRKQHYQNLCLRKTLIASSSCPSFTKTSGRCTRIKWLASGPLTKLTSAKIRRTGKSFLLMSSTSLSMCLPFLQPVMVLCSKIWPNASAQKFRCLRQGASTDSR